MKPVHTWAFGLWAFGLSTHNYYSHFQKNLFTYNSNFYHLREILIRTRPSIDNLVVGIFSCEKLSLILFSCNCYHTELEERAV